MKKILGVVVFFAYLCIIFSDGEIITSDDFVQIVEIFLLHEEEVMRASRPMSETKIASKMNKSGSKKTKNVESYYFTIT